MNFRSDFAQRIYALCEQDGVTVTPINGLKVFRLHENLPRTPVIYQPSICVVAQGVKHMHFGGQSRSYDPDKYLINSVTLPVEAQISGVTPNSPYVGLTLDIDRFMVSQLMLEMEAHQTHRDTVENADIVRSSALTERMQHCLTRLLDMLQDTMDRRILAPGLQREIFYEVLKGPDGQLLRNCISNHAGANRIARVVHYIEEHFAETLDIDTIARYAGMSTSSLHDRFKQLTSMSPMQFVKQLRLHQARALLISGRQASEASYEVGYSSPSQFSRDFKRCFGELPREVQGNF